MPEDLSDKEWSMEMFIMSLKNRGIIPRRTREEALAKLARLEAENQASNSTQGD